jgi:hypothetical protein
VPAAARRRTVADAQGVHLVGGHLVHGARRNTGRGELEAMATAGVHHCLDFGWDGEPEAMATAGVHHCLDFGWDGELEAMATAGVHHCLDFGGATSAGRDRPDLAASRRGPA